MTCCDRRKSNSYELRSSLSGIVRLNMPNILRAKCIVVGDPAAGKSAVLHTFLHDTDKFQKNYVMTCGIDIKTKRIAIPDTDDAVELLMIDSSGKDTYLDIQTQMWQHPSVVCVVYDITNENSFNSCSKWLDLVRNTGRYMTVPGLSLICAFNNHIIKSYLMCCIIIDLCIFWCLLGKTKESKNLFST
ncbi:intraflagellar transport protein 27 homolog [Parasteatoda tepidariorum]|uniref:intraflagellar transport protein 27 homolog n=1 Tax=Parasteatoda tepidariorum TaxID=114398 RepID=UPI0039BC4DEE